MKFLIFLMGFQLVIGTSYALGDLTLQEPINISIALGTESNQLVFVPKVLKVETGKLYRLKIFNPSSMKHYFSSDQFAQGVLTRKVQVLDEQGKPLSEIKGHIREIEVHPNAATEWWFVPVKAGVWNDLLCTIPGHAAAGMVGTIIVE